MALTVWVAIPAVVMGWGPSVITSNSMVPAFRSGDIVLMKPTTGEALEAGTVIAFEDPAGGGRVTHRIERVLPDGRYVTKGDANAFADSTPVEPERVEGVGRLLVPYVGLPLAWISAGAWLKLGVAALVAALLLSLIRPRPASPTSAEAAAP